MEIFVVHVVVDHYVIQTNSWVGTVFCITLENPITFKEDPLFPRETLMKSGWFNISLHLMGSGYNYSQNIWDKLKLSCEIAKYVKVLISIFRQFFASINKVFILGGRLDTRL